MGKNPKHKAKRTLPSNLGKVSSKKFKSSRISKNCSVEGCNKPSIHSLSKVEYEKALSEAGLTVSSKTRKFNICKNHYKSLKAAKRKENKVLRPKFDDRPRKMKNPKGTKFLE